MHSHAKLPGSSNWPRHSGLLCHITSLPGRGGCGDLGPEAYRFLKQLARGGQRAWQVLPMGPTGFGDSPYQTASVLGGNPLFIGIDQLVSDGLLDGAALSEAPAESALADFAQAQAYKWPLFATAFERLHSETTAHLAQLRTELAAFSAQQQSWLDDYALFMAIKEAQGLRPWTEWPSPLRDREPAALDDARHQLAPRIALHRFVQWLFEKQWHALRRAAHGLGIELIGDVPIFVAHDSVEVWSDRSQFLLHPDGQLQVQAGVPPDYFSKTGQLWGNPLYAWDRMQADHFAFWRRRIRRAAALFDRVRIDHFRGFAAHWEIPAQDRTAEFGRWVPAPGHALFEVLTQHEDTKAVRFIAEDLGVITPDVEELRDRFAFPGIRVLQFGFGEDDFYDGRPWAFRKNLVAYTSTHDNATIMGWYRGDSEGTRTDEQSRRERNKVNDYLGHVPSTDYAHFSLIRLVMGTPAETVIIPVQDVLGLGNAARMNTPGQPEGNWRFRLRSGQLDNESLDHLRHLTRLYARTSR